MNIVLLESLSVKHELMDALFAPLKLQGHTLTCYERTADEDTLIHEAQDAGGCAHYCQYAPERPGHPRV